MFDKLIYISLKNRLIVVATAIILITVGMIIAINLPVDVFPDLTAPSVTIITEAHGLAAEEVETLVYELGLWDNRSEFIREAIETQIKHYWEGERFGS